jgi:hypothetical protein
MIQGDKGTSSKIEKKLKYWTKKNELGQTIRKRDKIMRGIRL